MATLNAQQIGVMISAQMGPGFTATTSQVNAALAAMGVNAGAAGGQAAAGLKLSQQQLANMSFQMNDMATMLASGQNPFVLIMQQGMQIAQIFKPGTGVAGAMKAVGQGITSFITNPLNLMVVGIAAAAGAIQWLFTRVTDEGPTAQEILDQHREAIDRIREAYDTTADAAARYGRMTAVEGQIAALTEMRTVARQLGEQMTTLRENFGRYANAAQATTEETNTLAAIWTAFEQSLQDGTNDFDALIDGLGRMLMANKSWEIGMYEGIRGLYDTAIALRDSANAYEESRQIAVLLEQQVKNLDAALQGLGNSLNWAGMKVLGGLAGAREMLNDMGRAAGGAIGLAIDTTEVERLASYMRKVFEENLTGAELDAALADVDATVAARLASLQSRAAGAAGSAGAAITQVFNDEVDAAKAATEQLSDLLDWQVQTYQITQQQAIAQLRAAKEDEYRIVVDALNRQLAAEGVSADQRARINSQILEAEREHQAEMTRLTQDAITEQMRLVEDRWNSLTQSMTRALEGVLRGTLTVGEAIKQVLADMVLRTIEAVRRMIVQWIVGERAKTQATVAGGAARTAAAAAAGAAQAGAERVGIVRSILARAREVFAKVFSFMAPALGPAAAIPAGASQAAVAAQAAIPLAVGAWNVPRDMLALIHKGETVVPKNFAEGMRDGRGGFGHGMQFHYHAGNGRLDRHSARRDASVMFDAIEEEARRRNMWTQPATAGA